MKDIEKEISFRKALGILVNGGSVLVRNKFEQENDLILTMIDDAGRIKASDGAIYKISSFGWLNDHFYEVKKDVKVDCIQLDIKATYKDKQCKGKYLIFPKGNEQKITIEITDLMK